jgi:2,3-dihydroxy-2,3-dihydrophenylpropionate dehydrogenase/cis-2,3-dihydrobiphenyl-2,3-diol dehydrogenase
MTRLEGRVCLVAGGGSGLGREIARRFVDEGALVCVLEKSPDKAASLRAEFGRKIAVTTGDATESEDVDQALDVAHQAFDRPLDVLVSSIGLWDFGLELEQLPSGARLEEAFREVFAANVLANVVLARACVCELRESSGAIVLTSSAAGLHPGGGGPLYTASKHAVVGLVRELAYELAPDVRVNAVAPGAMRSDLRGPLALGLSATSISDIPIQGIIERVSPLGFLPDASDYTDWFVALASATESRTVTGTVIEADGGERVRGRLESLRARELAGEARDARSRL